MCHCSLPLKKAGFQWACQRHHSNDDISESNEKTKKRFFHTSQIFPNWYGRFGYVRLVLVSNLYIRISVTKEEREKGERGERGERVREEM
jgi:hypothetical protein